MRCGKKHLGSFVWLELNNRTNQFNTIGSVPPADSQGLFPFGKACAKTQLREEQEKTVAWCQQRWPIEWPEHSGRVRRIWLKGEV